MALTDGCNHVALVTEDMDRFIDFYVRIFEAEVVLDMVEGDLRHAMVDLGGGFCLHPFSLAGEPPHGRGLDTIFDRGHLDHVALNVADEEVFEQLRRRLVEEGASDGELTDFGMVRVVPFTDPDGMRSEIACWVDARPLTLDEASREPFVLVAS